MRPGTGSAQWEQAASGRPRSRTCTSGSATPEVATRTETRSRSCRLPRPRRERRPKRLLRSRRRCPSRRRPRRPTHRPAAPTRSERRSAAPSRSDQPAATPCTRRDARRRAMPGPSAGGTPRTGRSTEPVAKPGTGGQPGWHPDEAESPRRIPGAVRRRRRRFRSRAPSGASAAEAGPVRAPDRVAGAVAAALRQPSPSDRRMEAGRGTRLGTGVHPGPGRTLERPRSAGPDIGLVLACLGLLAAALLLGLTDDGRKASRRTGQRVARVLNPILGRRWYSGRPANRQRRGARPE